MARVTRPGGVVAAAVWDYGDGMEMLRGFWDEAVALDPASEPKDERHMPFCRPDDLAQLWKAQGLLDVQEEPLVIPMTFSSFDDFWSPFRDRQGPAGPMSRHSPRGLVGTSRTIAPAATRGGRGPVGHAERAGVGREGAGPGSLTGLADGWPSVVSRQSLSRNRLRMGPA